MRHAGLIYVYPPGHQGLKSRTNSILAERPRLRLYRPIGASGAEQIDSASTSPGGLVTAALQQEVSMLADSPKAALVPYWSEGWGPAWDGGNISIEPILVKQQNPGVVFFRPKNLPEFSRRHPRNLLVITSAQHRFFQNMWKLCSAQKVNPWVRSYL